MEMGPLDSGWFGGYKWVQCKAGSFLLDQSVGVTAARPWLESRGRQPVARKTVHHGTPKTTCNVVMCWRNSQGESASKLQARWKLRVSCPWRKKKPSVYMHGAVSLAVGGHGSLLHCVSVKPQTANVTRTQHLSQEWQSKKSQSWRTWTMPLGGVCCQKYPGLTKLCQGSKVEKSDLSESSKEKKRSQRM